jgi:hypothetical protein
MTKQVLIRPVITADMLEWLRVTCDVVANSTDNDKKLRWKAAQRDVYIKAKSMYERGLVEESNDKARKAQQLGHNIRSDQ